MITVREMRIDDIDKVCEIENDSFSMPWPATGFFTYLIREDALFIVACEDDEILGYCGLICVPDEGDITNVAVQKDCRGRGIGKKLISEIIKRGAEKGVKKIFLEVRVSNEAAIALYKNAGFVQVGLRKNYYEKPVEDAIIMLHEEKEDT